MKNKIIVFITTLSIFTLLSFNNIYAFDEVYSYSGVMFEYTSSTSGSLYNGTYSIEYNNYSSQYPLVLVYFTDGIQYGNYTYYYAIGQLIIGYRINLFRPNNYRGPLYFVDMPVGNFSGIYSSNLTSFVTDVYNYEDYVPEPEEPPILVKIFDVIVNSNAYQGISKLGKWVRDSVTDALIFEPVGSLISVNIGDTITVTDSNNTVTNIPTSYVLPSVTYNGGNTSVNINTNKIVDYMGENEVTFQSIKYDITYEYIDESENVVNETYTYNYNYNDKEIVYGPQEDPTANNSTDDTTITVNQPQGSQNVENSTGALGSVISTIASIFVGAINGLLGGIATIVGSLTNLITNTGGFFDAIGGVIAPFYQNTILGSIVNILGIGLFAMFIIGFFKK